MNQEDQKLDHKQTLKHLAKRLKQVLNPRITDADYTGKVGIKLVTDIPLTYSDIISFSVKCLSDNNGSKSIYTIGYFYSGGNLCATNLGSDRILQIGIYNDLENVNIILVPSEYSTILETESEVFITDEDQNGNKNHVISIEYLDESELEELELYLQTVDEGELDYHFSYIIQTGENSEQEITEGYVEDTPIDTIWKSEQSSKLDHTVNITVNGGDSHEEGVLIYGEGELDTTENTSNDLELTVDVEAITQAVSESISEDISQIIPDASTSERGVIALAKDSETEYSLGDNNKLPVETLTLDPSVDPEELPRAYVDVTKIYDRINQDVHRYENMSEASEEHLNIGEIVLYIGATTSEFVHGYFYMHVKEEVTGELQTQNTVWEYHDNTETTKELLNDCLTEYNKQNDHCLTSKDSFTITIKPDVEEITTDIPIDNDTEFIITNGRFTDSVTYSLLCDWGIEIDSNYLTITSSSDLNLYTAEIEISFPDQPDIWVQKNVQPPVHMQSALVYKGTITSLQGETDIEALERLVTNPDVGDFYIVKPSNLEYCWIDGENTTPHWEFMGDIFDPYEAGDGIAITSTHDISVKYDNSTIKKNGSGNLYVDGVLTDTQADWTESNSSSPAYINHKPTIPTVNDTTVVFVALGNNSDKFAQFTLNQGSNTEIIIKEGANINLYPDINDNQLIIEAIDTTYGDFAGSSHGLVPASTSGDSTKFLKGDGTWATPSGTGLTGVSFNGTAATVTSGVAAITASVGDTNVIETVKVNGSALTPDANKAVDITVPQGTVTSVTAGRGLLGGTITSSGTIDLDTTVSTLTPDSLTNSVAINSSSNRYVRVSVLSGDTLTINAEMTTPQQSTPKYVKEVVVRIDNVSTGESSPAKIKVNQSGTGTLKNMYNTNITGSVGCNIYEGDTLELVFTFWDNDDVTFNGGISV